jgi:hypothetical protein
VEALTSQNITVILDNQISNAGLLSFFNSLGWCCSPMDFNGVWYNDYFNSTQPGYNEEEFFKSWELL